MTMHRIHITHWPDWHTVKSSLGHLIHDPRFWAVVIVGGVVALMLIVSFLVDQSGGTPGPHPYGYPIYPYLP